MDIYVDDYALGFVAMMHEKAQLSNKPLGLWLAKEDDDYRWHVNYALLEYKRPEVSFGRRVAENSPERTWKFKRK